MSFLISPPLLLCSSVSVRFSAAEIAASLRSHKSSLPLFRAVVWADVGTVFDSEGLHVLIKVLFGGTIERCVGRWLIRAS